MNLGRLGNGQKIASISAILLFVFMFLDWFGTKGSDDSFGLFSVGRSAWEALDYIPVVLLIAIVAVLAVAALSLADAISRASTSANAVIAILGLVSASLILFRIIDPPTSAALETRSGPLRSKARFNSRCFSPCWQLRGSPSAAAGRCGKKALPPIQVAPRAQSRLPCRRPSSF